MELHLHLDGSLSPEFIAERATARGIEMPAPADRCEQSASLEVSRLRKWLMQQKVAKLRKDGNRADKGGNWPVFDFCNQFLQVLLMIITCSG